MNKGTAMIATRLLIIAALFAVWIVIIFLIAPHVPSWQLMLFGPIVGVCISALSRPIAEWITQRRKNP